MQIKNAEKRCRAHLGLGATAEKPAVALFGNFTSPRAMILKASYDMALRGETKLSDQIRHIEGMSGQKYRTLINNLVNATDDARYLEIGCWKGSTATAALYGNTASAQLIDNWSEFGGPRDEFFKNIELVRTTSVHIRILEQDFRRIDYHALGKFSVFMFDGPHSLRDHIDGITLPQPALEDQFTLIVDDWNWDYVRSGTLQGLATSGCEIDAAIEIRTTLDNSHPTLHGQASDWHNGYFLAVVSKV